MAADSPPPAGLPRNPRRDRHRGPRRHPAAAASRRNRLYLVEGVPGSGKTTLALQFLLEGVRRGEPVLYVTLSETERGAPRGGRLARLVARRDHHPRAGALAKTACGRTSSTRCSTRPRWS